MKTSKSLFTLLGCSLVVTLFAGCASTICGPKQSITVSSKPSQAEVLVYNAQCDIVFRGVTPCVASLSRCAPEEDRANYIILVRKEGFRPVQIPLTGHLNRAAIASIAYGGLGIIPDSITGSMWTLTSSKIEPKLLQDKNAFVPSEDGFLVSLKEQASQNVASRLPSLRE